MEKLLNVGHRLMGFSNGNLEDKTTERNATVDAQLMKCQRGVRNSTRLEYFDKEFDCILVLS